MSDRSEEIAKYGLCPICDEPNAPVVVMDEKTRQVVALQGHDHGRTLAGDMHDLQAAWRDLGRTLRDETPPGRALVRFVDWLSRRVSG